jgi:hypothetical protein
MWEAIQYVGTPVALVAFVVATAAYIYSQKLRNKVEVIKEIPKSKRAAVIDNEMETYRITPDKDNLTKEQKFELTKTVILQRAHRLKIISLTTIALAVILAGIVITAIISQPNDEAFPKRAVPNGIIQETSAAERNLQELYEKIAKLRGSVEGAENDNPGDFIEVHDKAPEFVDRLLRIPDAKLPSLIHQLIKYHLIAITYMMAATVQGMQKEKSIKYCENSHTFSQKVDFLINKANELESNGNISTESVNWISKNIVGNERYSSAVCLAIMAKYNQGVSISEAREALDDIPLALQKQYPPTSNQYLKWVIENAKKEEK